MSYVIGAIAGVVAGLACIWFVQGVPGIIAGVVVAVLLYVGVGKLLQPEAKLGDVAASMVPDGEAAAAAIAEARKLEGQVRKLGGRAASSDVRLEAGQLAEDLERLCAYVERQPATYRRLTHYLSTYGEQCSSVLENYLTIELAGSSDSAYERPAQAPDASEAQAHADVIEAMNALQGAAQGELKRAMGSKVAELSADSDAVRRLMEMDGYTTDARKTSGGAGASDGGGVDARPASAASPADSARSVSSARPADPARSASAARPAAPASAHIADGRPVPPASKGE